MAAREQNGEPLSQARAAARFAGAAARLNGRYCRGLQTLRALGAPAEEEVEWVGVNLPAFGEYELLPEEKARRVNRAKFYRKQDQPEPDRVPPSRRPIDDGEQAVLAAAASAARELVTATGVQPLAGPSNTQHTKLFAHQLAAAHRLMMRLSGRADAVVAAPADPLDRPEGLRLAHGAARLMERFRQGVAMLNRMRTDPDGPRRTEYYWSGWLSDREREEERAEDIAAGLDPDTGLPASPATSAGHSAPVLLRRGRLNNGNPGGDFLAAPRCGARTRAGCGCRQPAMANGRCRFHGGKSTGARTEAGQARARRARLVHGLRSAEVIALSAAAAAAHRRLGVLLAAVRPDGTHNLNNPPATSGTSTIGVHHRGHRDHRESPPSLARVARNHPSSVLSVSSVVNLSPAGHEVDRSESNIAAGSAAVLPFARPLSPRERAAGWRSQCRNRLPRVRS